MTEQVCFDYTIRRLIPGTGVFTTVPDDNWEAYGISALPVDPAEHWEYSFIPRRNSIFKTGLFDEALDPAPRVSTYVFGIEFSLFRLYPLLNGVRAGSAISWTDGQVVEMRATPFEYFISVNGIERWSAQR